MKTLILIILTLTSAQFLQAQSSNLQSAINYLTYYSRDNEKSALEKARVAIDAAAVNKKTMASSKVWLTRAKVYYLIILDPDYAPKYPNAVEEAYSSLIKSLELDVKGTESEEGLIYLTMIENALYNDGTDKYNETNYSGAYESFKKAKDAHTVLVAKGAESKLDTFIIYGMASSARKAGMKAEAKKMFQEYVDKNYDKDPNAFYMLSSIYLEDQDTTGAITALEQGLLKYPSDKGLITEQLRIYLDGNKFAELEKKTQDAINKDPSNPIFHFVMGLVYEEKSHQSKAQGKKEQSILERDNARISYEEAIKLNPDYFEAIYNLGNLKVEDANDVIEQIDALPYTATKQIDELTKKKDELFKLSLTYFEKARTLAEGQYASDPNQVNGLISTLTALKEIYTRLAEYDKANEVKNELADVNAGKKIVIHVENDPPVIEKEVIHVENKTTVVKMTKIGNTYEVPCKINGNDLKMIFDTGASDISISIVEVLYFLKNGFMEYDDLLESKSYYLANGSLQEGTIINIREFYIGSKKLTNVKAVVLHTLDAQLLLGQSALNLFGKITIDYTNLELIFEE